MNNFVNSIKGLLEKDGYKIEVGWKLKNRLKEFEESFNKSKGDEKKEEAIKNIFRIFSKIRNTFEDINNLILIEDQFPNSELWELHDYMDDKLDTMERFLCASSIAIANDEKIDDFCLKLIKDK